MQITRQTLIGTLAGLTTGLIVGALAAVLVTLLVISTPSEPAAATPPTPTAEPTPEPTPDPTPPASLSVVTVDETTGVRTSKNVPVGEVAAVSSAVQDALLARTDVWTLPLSAGQVLVVSPLDTRPATPMTYPTFVDWISQADGGTTSWVKQTWNSLAPVGGREVEQIEEGD